MSIGLHIYTKLQEVEEHSKEMVSKMWKFYKEQGDSNLLKHWIKQCRNNRKKLNAFIGGEYIDSNIKELLETHFPNQYEILEDSIMLHIPKVTITDNYGQQHEAYDFYFKLIDFDESHFNIKACRRSYTPEELFSNYFHSHIHYDTNWTTSICFGNSFNYKTDNILNSLELFLISLPTFLSKESSTTTPYKLISNIGIVKDKITKCTYNFNFLNIIDFDITLNNKDGYYYFKVLDNDKLDEYLIKEYPSKVYCYENNGNYFKSVGNSDNITTPDYEIFEFKGEKVQFELLPSQYKEPTKVINPYFKSKFINFAQRKITKKYYEISTVSKQNNSKTRELIAA